MEMDISIGYLMLYIVQSSAALKFAAFYIIFISSFCLNILLRKLQTQNLQNLMPNPNQSLHSQLIIISTIDTI